MSSFLIVSQSIYFEDMDGVAACLSAVAGDPCVRVVRVSHKLADDYDAEETAGYRDVSLGLRLRSEEACRLRLHGFVCELQLILVDFARIKAPPPCLAHLRSSGGRVG